MKTLLNKLFKLSVLLAFTMPGAAHAMSITYDVNLTIATIGLGYAKGTITTDGTIGALDVGSITGWDIALTLPGEIYQASPPNSNLAFSLGHLGATASELLYSDFGGGEVVFTDNAGDWSLSFRPGGSQSFSLVRLGGVFSTVHGINSSIIGTAVAPPATALPEPGTLGMAGLGMLAAGYIRRRKRR